MGEQKEQAAQMPGDSSSWVFYQQLERRRGHVDDVGQTQVGEQAETGREGSCDPAEEL